MATQANTINARGTSHRTKRLPDFEELVCMQHPMIGEAAKEAASLQGLFDETELFQS
jgi:hypothetical protein